MCSLRESKFMNVWFLISFSYQPHVLHLKKVKLPRSTCVITSSLNPSPFSFTGLTFPPQSRKPVHFTAVWGHSWTWTLHNPSSAGLWNGSNQEDHVLLKNKHLPKVLLQIKTHISRRLGGGFRPARHKQAELLSADLEEVLKRTSEISSSFVSSSRSEEFQLGGF